MAELSLFDLYDLTQDGESPTVDFPQYDPPFRVSAHNGRVDVFLVEDTSVETTLDPSTMDAKEFENAVFDFVDDAQNN